MLATSLSHRDGKIYLAITFSLVLTGCGTGAYEERLEATVQAMRAGNAAAAPGEAAEPPAASATPPGEKPVDPITQAFQEAKAAEATNASGQGVAGRAILAPTDAFP